VTTLLRILIIAACAGAAGCTAAYPTEPTKAEAVALYIAYATPKGRTTPGPSSTTNGYSFVAYTVDRDGAYERVTDRATWSSSNDEIARPLSGVTTAATRTFLAVSPGEANVIVRFQGLETTAAMLIVSPAIATTIPRLELAAAGLNVIGSPNQARAFYRPPTGSQQDVTNAASWSSSNPEIATVERGAIKAISSGTTIITANFEGLVDWFWFSVIPNS
jgi:hypothetical protein